MNQSTWSGKTAVICGGSQGLGLVIARELCKQQAARIILVARNAERLQAAVASLEPTAATQVTGLPCDVCVAAEVTSLAEQLTSLAAIDLVVQAVGMSDRGEIKTLSADRLRTLLDINVVSSLNVLQHLPAAMARPATMVLVGSLACHFAPRFLGGYAIAKHALAGLAQQSRLELAGEGIHVMLASPGPIQRMDAGTRYSDRAAGEMPVEALQPGGGAKVKGLEPGQLARDILRAANHRRPLAIFPAKARWLWVLSSLSPRLGDWLLRRNSA